MPDPHDPALDVPLAGVRVLDLTRLLPGPMATLILADLGARVDKLEDAGPGDYLRHMPPQVDDINGAYLALNRDKRTLVLDLKHPAGAAALLRILPAYDVLVESFRPGVLTRLGLSHARLLEANPRLVVCAITGYGQSGPLALRAGHDINYLARAGVLGVTGPADRPPQVSGAQMADVAGGAQWAVSGILAALVARARTGSGRVVDVSMTEGSIPLAAFALGGFFADGAGPARGASHLNGGIAAYRTYRTRDGGFVSLGALEPKFWLAFCAGAGLEGTLDALAPGEHQVGLQAQLEGLFASRTRDEWEAFARTHDCCLEPVLALAELPADPQHRDRQVFFEIDGTTHFRTPLGRPGAAHSRARAPGADTVAVLADAGMGPEEIAALRAAGAAR
jgi:crotonobetainyl-CoA:carnitine CoA-transferase CaiB-like acyl-CoA transferase